MKIDPLHPDFDTLPESLPIFPLDGVVLLPGGELPLNIFENRHISMVDDAFRTNRLIGMIQPFPHTGAGRNVPVFKTGCAGRITQFSEKEDGRYGITLHGICRFHVGAELPLSDGGYRVVRADWSAFADDMKRVVQCVELDRKKLCGLLRQYFEMNQITLDWQLLHAVEDDEILMTMLAMICPFSSSEKQAMLEAPCRASRATLFLSLLEMAVGSGCSGCAH